MPGLPLFSPVATIIKVRTPKLPGTRVVELEADRPFVALMAGITLHLDPHASLLTSSPPQDLTVDGVAGLEERHGLHVAIDLIRFKVVSVERKP